MLFVLILILFTIVTIYHFRASINLSVGKTSQLALVDKISELSGKPDVRLFLCMYQKFGNVLVEVSGEAVVFHGKDGILEEVPKAEISLIKYSSFGFFHIVTPHRVHKFAHIHRIEDAKSIYNATIGPRYREDTVIIELIDTFTGLKYPLQKASQLKLAFIV